MTHRTSVNFWKQYERLPSAIQQRAVKQFALLKRNPNHPSLQFKRVGEKNGQEIWSARVTLNDRALALKREDVFIWFWIGGHKPYEGLIS